MEMRNGLTSSLRAGVLGEVYSENEKCAVRSICAKARPKLYSGQLRGRRARL